MVLYYLLHHVLPESDTFKDGKRNCATFLFGSVFYAVVYGVLCNLELRHGLAFEAVRRSLFLVWMADATTMAYTYRSYYGRSILHEITPDDSDQRDWVYDGVTHKYRRPTAAERESKRLAEAAELERLKDGHAGQKRTLEIVRHKSRVKAARVIQQWWRAKLYHPPGGILYKRARQRFYAASQGEGRDRPEPSKQDDEFARGLAEPVSSQ